MVARDGRLNGSLNTYLTITVTAKLLLCQLANSKCTFHEFIKIVAVSIIVDQVTR